MMKPIDDDLVIQLMLTEPTVARLTEPVIAKALEGFELEPAKPTAWIARAIQGALYCTLRNVGDGPDRQANTDTKDELEALAMRATDLWRGIFERSSAADDALWQAAFRRWDGEGGTEIEGAVIGEPTEYKTFASDLKCLEGLAGFLRIAAAGLENQKGPWRTKEQREIRIERGHFLSPIYEQSYGREATINDWPNAKSLGPWPDFYKRIVTIAFSAHETYNLREILKEARRRHLAHKVEFAPGIIPA